MARHLFIGLQCPASWQAALTEERMLLCRQGLSRLRWLGPDRLHLSVKNLGYVDETDIEQIVMAMGEVAAACVPCELYIDALGVFRGVAAPDVLWAGVRGDVAGLNQMRETLEARFSPLGYPRDRGQFNPHITLARAPDELGRPVLSRVRSLEGELLPAGDPYNVNRFSLLHIIQEPGGVRHERVATANMAIH